MKKLLISALGISLSCFLYAQYIPQVSHFMNDYLRTNPGSAGSLDMVCVNGILRQQMVGFTGNPDDFFLNVEAPFSLLGTNHGAGLSIYRDNIGLNSDINLQLAYAYRFTIGDGSLGIGLNGGLVQNSLESDKFISSSGENPAGSDPNIPSGDPDGMSFTMGAGLFYRTEEIFFGISALNINSPTVKTTPSGAEINASEYNLSTQFYVTAGYNMQLTNPAWEFKPAVLLKSDVKATSIDLNLTCVYNKKIWGGVTYRPGEAVVGMIGLEILEGLRLGYAYDVQTTPLIKHTSGGHEVHLNYCLIFSAEMPKNISSVR